MTTPRKTYRTPRAIVSGFGATREGTAEAYFQRLTAVAMIPLTLAFIWIVLDLLSKDYNGVRAELAQPFPAIVLLLFIFAGVYHMQIGARAVILDYAPPHIREWVTMINTLFCWAVGVACAFAALRIAFV